MLASIRLRNVNPLVGAPADPRDSFGGQGLLMSAHAARRTASVLRFLPVLLIGFWLAEAIAWPHFASAEDGGGDGGGSGGGGGTGGGSGSGGAGEGEGGSSGTAGAGASGQAGGGSSNNPGPSALGRFFDRIQGNSSSSGNSGRRNQRLDTLVEEQALASAAVAQGKIRPFSEILHAVSAAVPGSILSVHLRERPTGSWIYNLVILSPEGRYRRITVDATNSRVLQIK
jgi:hypothetical protein